MQKFKILFVASEVFPFIKTGGLADVAYGLPKALRKRDHDIRVILPKYSQVKLPVATSLEFVTAIERNDEIYNIYRIIQDNITYYFIENRSFFERESLYENDDKDLQFALFSEIALRLLKEIEFKAEIIHCNDWQTGLIPYFLNKVFKEDKFYREMKTLYTIHNLRYQGWFGESVFKYLDYPIPDGYINFMKIGIKNADIINTVSKTYSKEIKTDYFGEGLNYDLNLRENDLYGIINGIDYDVFNPVSDKHIKQNYDLDSLQKKLENKLALQNEFKLPENENIPVIGIISRLTGQKGFDLIERVIYEMLEQDEFQLIILGAGESKYENLLYDLKHKFSDKVAVKIGYDEWLANRIYAGADIFLMPSLFEPCGLSQLLSMRYGTVPIVRETGGLNDTVLAYEYEIDEGNGFTFTNYNAHDMMYTIRRAFDIYNNDKETWLKLMVRGMQGNYSWDDSAEEYEKLYMKALEK